MVADRIRRAMNAGRRWATQQLKGGKEITPHSAEQAARNYSKHQGSQHLFIISALEILFEAESTACLAVGTERETAR
ncbi:hypothetical protein ACFPT7_07270 [Acidicapsa dinghuensis]|uniref:Uncharacterized protein n=1 Tax=Acidicapsa dinghuensis TaxID=2218256 RepID=A0ABW1EFE7_9BACT|nr:hypothetical protein [Acidicapsa dinghuensis]